MADITKYLDAIKSAVYGKDVRDSIHNSIEAINNQVENSETSAANSAADAKQSMDDALASSIAAGASESASENYKKLSQSYAMGETGERIGEDKDNAKYYKEQAELIVSSVTGSLRPMGTVAFDNLPLTPISGEMYNVSDEFVTDSRFKEGEGVTYPAGTNVYYTYDGYWDCLAGDLSKLITAVDELKVGYETLNSNFVYSTDEQVCGTWIDGKPIYRRIFDVTLDTTTENTIIDTEFNTRYFDSLVKISAFLERGHGTNNPILFPLNYTTESTGEIVYHYIGSGALRLVRKSTNMLAYTRYVCIVEYTK